MKYNNLGAAGVNIEDSTVTTTGFNSLNAAWIGAIFTPKESRTPEQNELLALSEMWQSVQFRLSDAARNPIVPMNSSTGIPFRAWTFLNTSSDIGTL